MKYTTAPRMDACSNSSNDDSEESNAINVVYHAPGPLYLDLRSRPQGFGAELKGFRRGAENELGAAEASGQIYENDRLVSINGEDMQLKPFSYIIEKARTAEFPLTLSFVHPPPPPPVAPPTLKKTASWTDLPSPSNGVKTLWNNLKTTYNRKTSIEERTDLIDTIEHVRLNQTGPYHTDQLWVSSKGQKLTERNTDLVMAWYRATPQGDFFNIRGVNGGEYQPSVDDVGARICMQCQSAQYSHVFKLVEVGPIDMDPKVQDIVSILVDAGFGSFSATLASHAEDSFQIKVDRDHVIVACVSEDATQSGVVKHFEYNRAVQVILDPVQTCRFTLIFQEEGWTLGDRPGAVCDLHEANLATMALFIFPTRGFCKKSFCKQKAEKAVVAR